MFRLRQIAIASRRLDAVLDHLCAVLGLKVAFRDPAIIHYGLRNAVLPAGRGFIEVLEPVQPNASAGRFLDRWGGDAGYMVILQTDDAAAEAARLTAEGVRIVDRIETPDYLAFHFHPADCGGVLLSFDQQRTEADPLAPFGDWAPAGPDWRAARTPSVQDLRAVVLAHPEPSALAGRWARLLNAAPGQDARIRLDDGEIAFIQDADLPRTSVAALEIVLDDPDQALARARRAGLPCQEASVTIGGVRFDLRGA